MYVSHHMHHITADLEYIQRFSSNQQTADTWLMNIIIIVIALTGTIRDCLQSSHCAANRLQHVRSSGPKCNRVQIMCNTSSAYHVQHVVLCATWYEGTAQRLCLTEHKLHLFEFYFIGWTINWGRRGRNQSTQRKPLVKSFRKCHIPKPED